MHKLFWDDPYVTTCNANIVKVDDNDILCDQTIIFSFCGGQESDTATINNLPVLNSRIDNKDIWYTMPNNHRFLQGQTVTMHIDWPRRYRLMRLHFATELVLELIAQKTGFLKVGAHISESKSRIDFKAESNISGLFPEILSEYNTIIENDFVIIKDFSDKENERRFWKIEGFAQVPCGGTHVKSTKEVGYISLKRDKPGKGVERVEIKLLNP